MSWLICLRFRFTRCSRVCVYLIALVWIGKSAAVRAEGADHHSANQLETSRSWTNLSAARPLFQHSRPTASHRSANVEGSHYENKWFLFQPGSWVNCSLPFYFIAELVGLKLSSNLSSPFPRILWIHWILWSLTVCTCAFAALCFTSLILTRQRFVSLEQTGCLFVQIYVPCPQWKSLPTKIFTTPHCHPIE